jgi:hypothetical protein
MKRNSQFSAMEVAQWMLAEFNRNGVLFHDIAVDRIRELFGFEFTHPVDDGYYGIDQDVLKEFRALTKDTVVWMPAKKYWRKRTEADRLERTQKWT